MPWRLIQFIVLFAVFLVFIMFNLENKCDISFGFTVISYVPVFVTVFFSFMIGMLCILPFVFMKPRKKTEPKTNKKSRKKDNKDTSIESDDTNPSNRSLYGID